jgi:dienelactone hydrolase
LKREVLPSTFEDAMKKLSLSLFFSLLLLIILATTAQQPRLAAAATEASTEAPSATAEPQNVKIKMEDGLEIKGVFYAVGADKGPAVLLLHQHGGRGAQWAPLIPALTKAGYNVLTVDMRGQGETGGGEDWVKAEKDGLALMNWLREQVTVNPTRVGVIGASIGSNLAIKVCAGDEKCFAVVALSPGLNYYGVSPKDSIESMKQKALMLVAAQRDTDAAQGVKALTFATTLETEVIVRIYKETSLHGVDMLYMPDLPQLIVDWLNGHNK